MMQKNNVLTIGINRIHHVAVIFSDYRISKHFYVEILGLKVIAESYRADRKSYKLDLQCIDGSQIELFSFENSPQRQSYPEARGVRHLAFEVADIHETVQMLQQHGVSCEPIRIDEYTGGKFPFFVDPDLLPIELYEPYHS